MKPDFDVVIIGAGLAGLQCARLLGREANVLLVDRKHDLTRGIHTTGIFVRKTFEDFEFPAGTLGRPISDVTLYSPTLRKLEMSSPQPEFRVGRMGDLYAKYLKECIDLGVQFYQGTKYIRAERAADHSIVTLERNGQRSDVTTKVLVGADGAVSRVARDLDLDENREWIVGYEEVFKANSETRLPRLHCFLDAKLAPGYLAWIADDGDEVHLGVGGHAEDFDPRGALRAFKAKAANLIANRHGILIGDAAGAVSPLTAGGLDPCMRLSAMAAGTVTQSLCARDPDILQRLSGERFRARFISRIWMRRMIALMSSQFLLEFGAALLMNPVGALFARHVFFGRGSFPEVEQFERAPMIDLSRDA